MHRSKLNTICPQPWKMRPLKEKLYCVSEPCNVPPMRQRIGVESSKSQLKTIISTCLNNFALQNNATFEIKNHFAQNIFFLISAWLSQFRELASMSST